MEWQAIIDAVSRITEGIDPGRYSTRSLAMSCPAIIICEKGREYNMDDGRSTTDFLISWGSGDAHAEEVARHTVVSALALGAGTSTERPVKTLQNMCCNNLSPRSGIVSATAVDDFSTSNTTRSAQEGCFGIK